MGESKSKPTLRLAVTGGGYGKTETEDSANKFCGNQI
jgi:hypothetical protein